MKEKVLNLEPSDVNTLLSITNEVETLSRINKDNYQDIIKKIEQLKDEDITEILDQINTIEDPKKKYDLASIFLTCMGLAEEFTSRFLIGILNILKNNNKHIINEMEEISKKSDNIKKINMFVALYKKINKNYTSMRKKIKDEMGKTALAIVLNQNDINLS